MRHRVRTAVRLNLREFRRTPVLLALFVVLPAYIIGAFVLLVPDTEAPVHLDDTVLDIPMPEFAAALMTPVTVAILSGIVGLFLVQMSQAADDRLRLAGYSVTDLVVSRIGTLAVGTLAVTAVSVLVAVATFTPDSLVLFVLATALVGLSYGIVGVIVGILLDRLGGVYVLLFAPMVDVLMFQNPLATDTPSWATALPSHFATNALFDAAFTGEVAAADLAGAAAYTLALLLASIGVFSLLTR